MTLVEYYDKGVIQDLYDKGLISVNQITYFRYNKVFEAYLAKGMSRNKAYIDASDECGCSEMTIRRAVRAVTKHC